MLFGGRRASAVPLVTESFSWQHGVFLGANVASEKTAAAEGTVGELRRDPFAMLPFCGYSMGDYIGHWLSIGRSADDDKLPRLYYVNWFRKDEDGNYVARLRREQSRAGVDRGPVRGTAEAQETAIGRLPTKAAFDLDGLDIDERAFDAGLSVDVDVWRHEAGLMPEFLRIFGDRMPRRSGTSMRRCSPDWPGRRPPRASVKALLRDPRNGADCAVICGR